MIPLLEQLNKTVTTGVLMLGAICICVIARTIAWVFEKRTK